KALHRHHHVGVLALDHLVELEPPRVDHVEGVPLPIAHTLVPEIWARDRRALEHVDLDLRVDQRERRIAARVEQLVVVPERFRVVHARGYSPSPGRSWLVKAPVALSFLRIPFWFIQVANAPHWAGSCQPKGFPAGGRNAGRVTLTDARWSCGSRSGLAFSRASTAAFWSRFRNFTPRASAPMKRRSLSPFCSSPSAFATSTSSS